jgi:hypothetical protein
MSEPINDAMGKDVIGPSKSSRTVARLLVGTLIAVLSSLFFAELIAALNARHDYFVRHSQAKQRLLWLGQQIASYRAYHGDLPRSLADLYVPLPEEVIPADRHDWDSYRHFGYDGRFDTEGRPFDPWGVPYRYEVKDAAFELYSMGDDGTPGGIGINLDLKYDDPPETANSPTIGQLLWDKPAGRVRAFVLLLALAGGVTLIATFAYVVGKRKPSAAARQNLSSAFIAAFTVFILIMLFMVVIVMSLAWAQDSWYYLRPDPPPYVVSQ